MNPPMCVHAGSTHLQPLRCLESQDCFSALVPSPRRERCAGLAPPGAGMHMMARKPAMMKGDRDLMPHVVPLILITVRPRSSSARM